MEIVWKGEARPDLEDRVNAEVAELMAGSLGHIDDLIVHIIEIGDDIEIGPLVEIHGHGGKIYAEYVQNPEWKSLHVPQT